MTVDEIALMRAIVRWRRMPAPMYPRAEFYRRRWSTLSPDWTDVTFDVASVDDEADGYATLYYSRGRYVSYEKTEVRTVTQAVDLLVAFGYLPPKFSSAYRAGFKAGRDFQNEAEAYRGGSDYAQSLLPAVTP
jgi:hypothetical protein